MTKTTETRRLDRLAHSETANQPRRYKLPEAAADLIDKAGKTHGQKSRAIQIAVEILWQGYRRAVPLVDSDSPIVGRSYKLPPRTLSCIERLAKDNALTQGQLLSAVANVLADLERKK